MRRFSRLFWFTVFAGTLASSLVSGGLVWHLTAQLHEMVALCAPRNDSCGAETIDRAFQVFCLMVVAGDGLAFWLANRIGRSFIKPAAADAVR
jgi:hypothetical protein